LRTLSHWGPQGLRYKCVLKTWVWQLLFGVTLTIMFKRDSSAHPDWHDAVVTGRENPTAGGMGIAYKID